MGKYIYDEKNELWHESNGEYYSSCLNMEDIIVQPIGKYGRMRKRYLKEYRRGLYADLVLSGELRVHPMEIDKEARRFVEQTIFEIRRMEGVSEDESNRSNGMDTANERYSRTCE